MTNTKTKFKPWSPFRDVIIPSLITVLTAGVCLTSLVYMVEDLRVTRIVDCYSSVEETCGPSLPPSECLAKAQLKCAAR